jgi:hypothetical protein
MACQAFFAYVGSLESHLTWCASPSCIQPPSAHTGSQPRTMTCMTK